MALHPTYLDLLESFFWWCHAFIGGNHIPPYSSWIRTTRADYVRYLEGVLWKAREVRRFDFPIVGVLPGTLLKVLSRPLVPVQPPPVLIEEVAPVYEEQILSSKESPPEVAPVLLASPEYVPH